MQNKVNVRIRAFTIRFKHSDHLILTVRNLHSLNYYFLPFCQKVSIPIYRKSLSYECVIQLYFLSVLFENLEAIYRLQILSEIDFISIHITI